MKTHLSLMDHQKNVPNFVIDVNNNGVEKIETNFSKKLFDCFPD